MIQRFIDWMRYMGKAPMTELSLMDEVLMCVFWVLMLAIIAFIGCLTEWLERWWKDD